MVERKATIERETSETTIKIELNVHGKGTLITDGGVGFFNHLLGAMARYALFDLKLKQKGDLHIDGHHLVEDIGICFGQALRKAMADRSGIRRFGSFTVPMDEALVQATLDLCGRASFHMDYDGTGKRVGDFDCGLANEFLVAFAQNAGLVLHLLFLRGYNDHHMLEAAFKAIGWALREACADDPLREGIPSTKNKLD